MKAKEKAKQLVDRFYPKTYQASVKPYYKGDAKECALIAVNEIISALVGLGSISYWEEVKKEINSLK